MEGDERFKGISTDPRFRPLPSRLRKVKIDQRFKGMFTDKKFKVKCSIDERGRPVKLSSNKHLKKFYELSSSEDEDDGEEEKKDEEKDVGDADANDLSSEQSESSADEEVIGSAVKAQQASTHQVDKDIAESSKERKRKKKRAKDEEQAVVQAEEEEEVEVKEINPREDYARGLVMMSSSEDDDDSDDESDVPYDQEAHDDHYWGDQDKDAEETEESTRRLAIQSMDWDRIKAVDLFMLLNSFKPASGTVHNVKIYPSEFGKQKMKEDDLTGPKELHNTQLNDEGEAEGKLKALSDKDQKKAMLENLRQYQLNRLKYFYAIAEFDSPETANHVYSQCDSQEYLASCTQLDLRFVPDDMEFAEDEVKDSANHIPDKHEPKFFINPALGQSLVRCTWDESNPDRYSMLNKKYKAVDLEELDMNDYLASESGEESAEEKKVKTIKKKSKLKPEKPPAEPAETALIAEESSDNDDEADEDEKSIEKYRQLLLGGADKSQKSAQDDDSDAIVDMEITWDTGLKDTTEDILKRKVKKKRGTRDEGEMSVFERERVKKRDKAKQLKKMKKVEELESVQAFSDDEIPDGFEIPESKDKGDKGKKKKKTSKKKLPSADGEPVDSDEQQDGGGTAPDLDLMLMNTSTGSKKHFNIKEIAEYENMTKSKRKRKLKKNQLKEVEDDFHINVKDDRFSALYSSHLYNIDPSSQDYRKTKAMDSIIDEKQRRIRDNERTVDRPTKRKPSKDAFNDAGVGKRTKVSNSISSLVKSVKAKSKMYSVKRGAREKK